MKKIWAYYKYCGNKNQTNYHEENNSEKLEKKMTYNDEYYIFVWLLDSGCNNHMTSDRNLF